MEQHEERWWEAEIARLRGVVLLQQTTTQQEEGPKPGSSEPLRSPATRRRNRWSCGPRQALSRLWQHQGKRAEARQLLGRSTAGSPRALTLPTSRRPEHCWRS